jgi:hypothetical protein
MAQIIIRICAKADGFRDILAKLLAAAQIEIANELSFLKLKSYKLPLIDQGLFGQFLELRYRTKIPVQR